MSRQLTLQQVEVALRQLGELDVVLIGGQAVQFWCREYSHAPELVNDVFTSKDVDFQGTKDALIQAAFRLDAEPRIADMRALPMLGIVEFDAGDGEDPFAIDFLLHPTGLVADVVLRGAIKREADGFSVLVMHPLHCLISRLENVHQAPHKYDNPHGLKQLKAAIVCVREYIRAEAQADIAASEATAKDVAKICESVSAISIWRTRQIDATSAIPTTGLSATFYEHKLPRLLARIERKRAAT